MLTFILMLAALLGGLYLLAYKSTATVVVSVNARPGGKDTRVTSFKGSRIYSAIIYAKDEMTKANARHASIYINFPWRTGGAYKVCRVTKGGRVVRDFPYPTQDQPVPPGFEEYYQE